MWVKIDPIAAMQVFRMAKPFVIPVLVKPVPKPQPKQSSNLAAKEI